MQISTTPWHRRAVMAVSNQIRVVMAAWLVLGLLGPVALSAQAPPQLPPLKIDVSQIPDIVARIDGDSITKRELLAQSQTMRIQALQAGAADPADNEDFLSFVLDALIGERLIFADGEKRGVGVTDTEATERVEAIIKAYGGQEAFEKALEEQGLDRAYVQRQVKQSMTIDKLMEGEIMPTIKLADEDLKAYYDRFSDQMKVPTTYKVRHIMKRFPPEGKAAVEQTATGELEGLRKLVEEGGDFAALATLHTDDERSREQGGELPWMALTGREGKFGETVAQLDVGGMSGVIESAEGLHLIQLVERRPERTRTFEEARPEINNILGAYEAREEIQRRITDLKGSAKIEILIDS